VVVAVGVGALGSAVVASRRESTTNQKRLVAVAAVVEVVEGRRV
jgi:hypothetical protein